MQFGVEYKDGNTNSFGEVIRKSPYNSITDIADCIGTGVVTDLGDGNEYEGLYHY